MSNNRFVDLAKVKEIPITDILTYLGIEPVRRGTNDWAYHAPWREDLNASLHVRPSTNTWKDFADEKSGTSNIDLIIKFGIAHDWREAALWILNIANGNSSVSLNAPKGTSAVVAVKSSVASLIVEDIEIKSENLYRYGESRGIARPILKKYCREVTFRSQGGRLYTAIGFRNNSGGYVLRYDWLKCNLGPSTYSFLGELSSSEICVFEGFFDFLSFKMLYPGKACHYLVLNSVVHSTKAAQFLRSGKYSHVMCFLDADAKGRESLGIISSIPGSTKVYDVSRIYSYCGHKDLNELLMSSKQ